MQLSSQLIVLLVSLHACQGYDYNRDPVRRSIGSVIPWPKNITFLNGLDYLEIGPGFFEIRIDDAPKSCDIVARAVKRYSAKNLFDDTRPLDRDDSDAGKRNMIGNLSILAIRGDDAFVCETIPDENMDETYSLDINKDSTIAQLRAKSSWGLIRGLETFSQLVFNVGPQTYAIQPVSIEDEPRFSHRGFMLDTARHYISVGNILKMLDSMAMNKLNVFHWHIVDDQSFPYESIAFPEITGNATFRPNMIYTQTDVKSIIQYAADRGIRVIPEFDTPGHSYAWRFVSKFLTRCYDPKTNKPNGNYGPVNPTKIGAYKTMSKLIDELGRVFPDKYLHIGGDEVETDCWKSNPKINSWLKTKNMTNDYRGLSKFYVRRLYDLVAHHNKTMQVWQEVFDDGTNLPKDTIVQVWKYINDKPAYTAELNAVVRAGYKAILSSCWYLNYIDYGQDWVKFYQCDPTAGTTSEDYQLVLGGEICMWTEFVDDTNVLARTWPRASAAAERLWSPLETSDVSHFMRRLEQIRCRFLSRGLQAEPIVGPGYC